MKPTLKRKLRNWLIIYSAVAAVILVVKVGGRLVGVDTNPSGLAIVVGGSIWFALEGEQKFAQIKQKYGKKNDARWD